ncbi:MAG: hypothetical protein Fues2KO_02760 [Fuerstiella sp.]
MNSLLAVFRFEFNRIMTPGRAVWWLLVVAFPVLITILIRTHVEPQLTRGPNRPSMSSAARQEMQKAFEASMAADQERFRRGEITREQLERNRRFYTSGMGQPPRNVGMTPQQLSSFYTIVIYFLAPSVACMLGALLTAAPSVASELEQHSWTYLATRPNGLFHLVMGKFLVAWLWAGSSTVLGVLLSLPFARIESTVQNGGMLVLLSIVSAASYSALYTMIGTLFPQRAMVFCVAYTAGVEMFLGTIPAVVNRLTIQYRLRSLLYHGVEIVDLPTDFLQRVVASSQSAFTQVFWLTTLVAIFLAVALTTVQVREFTTAAEGEMS